ncbi:MAG TPA: ammonia-forming cytochrome c nitrite reductase [Ignavibacteria bacterium]|nr:ammonia-forming cytochrome c nitrite reductase [Ignavibacteria bacterium]
MSISDKIKAKPWLGWVLYGATVVVVFIIGLFASTIIERRSESNLIIQNVKPISDWEPKNEVWGENYPREYQTYLQTKDTSFASKHGGSATIDMLERYPDLVILWAGYAFSREYSQSRGHYWAINDIRRTLRTDVPQPATCWTCKSPDVPRMMNQLGIGEFYKKQWKDLGAEIVNPIGCQDCHDNKTMNLRISRPALVEAFQRQGKDIKNATHNEMRNLVCAQCHVEYYFKGKEEKYLTFPWDKGFNVEDIEKYYDEYEFTDWTHKLSRAPMLKAQHPDFELFQMGIHGQRGVTCADCHMPYKSEGGIKFTDHHVQSPLNNVANSCQVCHRESENILVNNVRDRQDKVFELGKIAAGTLSKAHITAKTAWDNGATEEQMKPVLTLIRHAQWRWDFVAASHGGSFHAPLECARILGTSIQKSQEALNLLTEILMKQNVKLPVQMPDISTKLKAQQFIGLNMDSLYKAKSVFINDVIPMWNKTANEKGNNIKDY